MTRTVAGVVLAGGQSQRFGRDKAEALLNGRTLLQWSIAALRPYCDTIIIAGRDHPDFLCAPDRPHPGLGPLSGIAGAMAVARDAGFSHILTLPCDTPEVPDAVLDLLLAEQGAAYLRDCPVIGLWPTAEAKALETRLATGAERSVRHWAQAIGAKAVTATAGFRNINYPADIGEQDHGDR